ncbi:MAG: hypothetical protein ACI8PZ_001404 [Myxococcota bacterium]|jgi:hypothetical protein
MPLQDPGEARGLPRRKLARVDQHAGAQRLHQRSRRHRHIGGHRLAPQGPEPTVRQGHGDRLPDMTDSPVPSGSAQNSAASAPRVELCSRGPISATTACASGRSAG